MHPHPSSSFRASWPKYEASLIILAGLIVVVLVSTQHVLSKVSPQSNRMIAIHSENIHNVEAHASNATNNMGIGTVNGWSNEEQHGNSLQELGWMQAVVEYRIKMANLASEMETNRENNWEEIDRQVEMGFFNMDISPLFDLVSEMVDVLGVRGVIFDVLSDDYDYFLYYPDKPEWDCTTSAHGVGCYEDEAWWFYHFTGAIITDKFLRDGNGKVLWDGGTGRYIDDFASLIQEIQKYQQLPIVNQASFHVEHALLWHFLASVMPDAKEYPSDLADALCGWDSQIRKEKIMGRGVGKGIVHECYHGFGHAVFYVVAKRQAQEAARDFLEKNPGGSAFSRTSFRSTGVPSLRMTREKNSKTKEEETPNLYVAKDGKVSISTQAAIAMAKKTADSSSARKQFRPNSGFEMTDKSMCEVYHLCKGAKRKSDRYYEDEEIEYPYSHGVRICLEGVVHSVRLFSTDRHDKPEAIDYVNKSMQRCQAEEMGVDNALKFAGQVEHAETKKQAPLAATKNDVEAIVSVKQSTSHNQTQFSPVAKEAEIPSKSTSNKQAKVDSKDKSASRHQTNTTRIRKEETGTGKEGKSPPNMGKKVAPSTSEPRHESKKAEQVDKKS